MREKHFTLQPLPARSRSTEWALVLALCLSSGLSAAMYLARVWYTESFSFFFLNWNLLLAWIPFGVAVMMHALSRSTKRAAMPLAFLFAVWLLFFPNAPYLVSDLMHLAPRQNVPLWYDAMLLFSYAWNGLILGFASLWLIQQLVAERLGAIAGWMLVMTTLLAAGFGIYLGRFERWNSWDVVVDPIGRFGDILAGLLNPLAYPRAIVVTLLFAAFMAIAYSTVHLFATTRVQPETTSPRALDNARTLN